MTLKTPTASLALGERTYAELGRAAECDLAIDDPQVSRRHARLEHRNGGWHIRDLESANGTFLNDQRLEPGKWTALLPGTALRLGTCAVQLLNSGGSLPKSGQTLLEARGLGVEVGGKRLLDDISLSIPKGSMVALIGPSGAGKTTLLLTLNGYTPPSQGEVRLGGLSLADAPELCRHIGYVPQEDLVPRSLTVQQALESAAQLRLPAGQTPQEHAERIETVLRQLQLTERRDSRIGLLSGGERKRVNIAVELLARPAVLFLDEPTTGLDAALERRVTGLLRELADLGTTIVCVTHAAATLDKYDLVAALAPGGTLVAYGAPGEVRAGLGARGDATLLERAAHAGKLRQPVPLAQNPVSLPAPAPPPGFIEQLGAFLRRGAQLLFADSRFLALALLQMPLLTLLLQALFSHKVFAEPTVVDSHGRPSVQDAPQILFLMALAATCFPLFGAARELVRDRALLARERHLGLSLSANLLARVGLLSALSTVQAGLLVGCLNLFIPLPSPLHLAGVLALASLCATLLGLGVSAASTSLEQATTVATGLFIGQVILSGLVALERLGPVLRTMSNLVPLHWCYGALCGLAELPRRWEDAGISSLLHDTLRIKTPQATAALGALCLAATFVLFATLLLRAQKDRTRHA